MIQYECFCGYTKEVPDDWVGKNVKCPKCGNTGEVFKIAEPPPADEQWNVADRIPSRMQGHWRPSPYEAYQPSGPMTYNQGVWIIALLAIPFVFGLIAILLYLVAAMVR